MSQAQTLKSYLVGLGFAVDAQQYRKFEGVLSDAARSVKKETLSIGADLLKWQIGITGLFTSISSGILSMMDKVANADQEYRLFGERMFISTNNARSLKVALDALGQPLEAIAFDPELHARFLQLQKDQLQLSHGLGGDFESQMRSIRDMNFELTRLKVELQYLAMGTVSQIFKGLFGDGDVLKKLREWNDWMIHNLPTLAAQFSNYLVPILKDTWGILKEVVMLVGLFATEFTNLVSVISGDSSLRTSEFNFNKFALAIDKVANGLASVIEWLTKMERYLPLLEVLGGAGAGAALGSIIPGVGTGIGAGVGAAAGGILGVMGRLSAPSATAGGSDASSSVVDQARQAAKSVGMRLGVDPSIIFAQWAHETGNFSNRGATSLNNLAGIRLPGSTEYRSFDSVDDFADYYSKQIQRNYSGALGANNVDTFATALKNGRIGSYYGDTLQNYERGMRSHIGDYDKGSVTHINVGDINVMQPNASADEIARQVTAKIKEQQDKQTKRNLVELTPVFQ